MIDYALTRQQAEDLFTAEAILFGDRNGIPEYRIVELFGEWAGAFFEKHVHYNGYMIGGTDYNARGDCSPEKPMLRYLYRSGLFKIVSEHNYRIALNNHRSSEAGRVVDALWQARKEAMEAREAEEERKREERKAKRAAARKAKEEAQEKEQEAAV